MNIKHWHIDKDAGIWISNHLLNYMYRLAADHHPKEFGGILCGIRTEGDWFITDFEVPEKYSSSTTNFTRYANRLNKYLKSAYDESKGHIEYLGEWHTHPNARPDYSSNDKKSMLELAADKRVTTNTPILIIMGTTKKKFNYKIFQCLEGELIHLDKIIQI